MSFLKNLYRTFEDRKILKGEIKKTCDFVFLVHPRDISDIISTYSLFSFLPKNFIKFLVKFWWPVRIASITGLIDKNGNKKNGWIVSCPITADMMLNNRGLATKKIIETAKLGVGLGAPILGLGALTASLSRGGLDITDNIDVRVTTGRLYTVINICSLVSKSIKIFSLDKERVKIAIVGAAGSIGAGVAQKLADDGYKFLELIDLSSKKEDVRDVYSYCHDISKDLKIIISEDFSNLKNIDIIVTATNHPEALIVKEKISPGTIIIDDAQPSDVEKSLFESKDFLILEGGVVHTEKIRIPFRFGLQNEGDVFSCLAELLILASSNSTRQSPIGRELKLDFETVDFLEKESKKLGFKSGAFQNYKKLYREDEVLHVKKINQMRL